MSAFNGEDKITVHENIYKYYLGEVNIGYAHLSPLSPKVRGRNNMDSNPSFTVYETTHGNYRWKDHGAKDGISGDAINLIQLMEGFDEDDFLSAMEFYNNVISNSDTTSTKVRKVVKTSTLKPTVYYSKKFNFYELKYLDRYGFTRGDMIRRDIYAFRGVDWGDNILKFKSSPTQPKFIFKLTDKTIHESFKIYNPLAFEKRRKWKSHNVHDVILEGMHTLPRRGNTLIIASSTKDSVVIEKLNLNVYSRSPTSEASLNNIINNFNILSQRFKYIYSIFDNDKKGVEAGNKLKECCGIEPIYLLPYPIKDVSDYVEKYGYNKLRKILKGKLKK